MAITKIRNRNQLCKNQEMRKLMDRVMVIDNDMDSNRYIVNMLQKEGFEAVGILRAKKGIEYLTTGLFDLIVMEILMPEIDGIEVLISMKKNMIHVPVIAISGGGIICPEYYLALAFYFDVDHTFVKPIDRLPFLSAIRKCLNQTNGVHDE
jgi:CheY-like chemotaxis protein